MLVTVLQINATVADDVTRVVGGDISLVPAYEAAGDDWLDASGLSITSTYSDGMVTYLRDVAGWNAIRVRLLVDPTLDDKDQYDEYLGTCQDIEYVKALGKRIKDAGMYFLLDIFYSDTWTDVSKQWIPDSWGMDRNTATETLAAQVKSYTTDVINQLVAYGAAPDYVQIGNEVSYGMLWDSYSGKNNSTHFFNLSGSYSDQKDKIDRFAALLNAGAEGVRASNAPDAKIVLHSERTINSTYTKNFYDYVEQGGFTDYDVIGLSYYPAWQGSLSNLESTLSTLISAYPDKEIQIVESGYYSTSDVENWLSNSEKAYCTWGYDPAAQASFLSDLTTTLNNYPNVTGFYYWQPEECGNGADADGNDRVKGSWDYRGFWELSWQSASHPLISENALMTVQNFNHTALNVSSEGGSTTTTTDVSSVYFENLDFESCSWDDAGNYVSECPGWTLNYDDFETNWPKKDDGWMSSLISNYLLVVWEGSKTIAANAKVCSQTSNVELPAGTYTITAVVHADGTDSFALYASANGETVTTAISNSGSGNWANASIYNVSITLETAASLEIGIMTTADINAASTDVNLYVDNFKVIQTVTNEEDGIDAIKTSPTTSNAIYNIQGMRVSDTSKKGLYIINGKKVLVR